MASAAGQGSGIVDMQHQGRSDNCNGWSGISLKLAFWTEWSFRIGETSVSIVMDENASSSCASPLPTSPLQPKL